MAEEELSNEDLKDIMRANAMIAANIENWKYVLTNAEFLEKKDVINALEQILSIYGPIAHAMQMFFEVEALTKLDPNDLI